MNLVIAFGLLGAAVLLLYVIDGVMVAVFAACVIALSAGRRFS